MTWMVTATVGLLAMAVPGPALGAPTTAASQPHRLRIGTFNINCGIQDQRSLEDVVRTITQAGADILAIQEGNEVVYAHLRRALAKDFPHMVFHASDGAGGFGWLSKLPLKDARLLAHKAGWFDTALAQVEIAGRTVQLANVHLVPVRGGSMKTAAEALKVLSLTEKTRMEEIAHIWSNLPADQPLLIVGDFNSVPVMGVPAFLQARGMVDSYASVTKPADQKTTHHWDGDGTTVRFRIDYIWHSAHFRTLRSDVVASQASDHDLVVSQITMAGDRTPN